MELSIDIKNFVAFLVKNNLTKIEVQKKLGYFGDNVIFHDGRGNQFTIQIYSEDLEGVATLK